MGIVHVPEGRRLFPALSVMSNLELGASLRKDKTGIKKDLDEIFVHFPRLLERRNQSAGTLSGGRTANGGNCPRFNGQTQIAVTR